jgi:hypothetical protein
MLRQVTAVLSGDASYESFQIIILLSVRLALADTKFVTGKQQGRTIVQILSSVQG